MKGVLKSVFFKDVIASASADGFAVVWVKDEPKYRLDHKGQNVYSCAFSPNGDYLLTTAADKKTRVWDVRAEEPLLREWASAHDGVKASVGCWVSDDVFVTAGFSKIRERNAQVMSVSENKQLSKMTLDNGTGVLTIHCDQSTNLLFVSGKGDSTVKVFELISGKLSPMDPAGDPKASLFLCFVPFPLSCLL